MVAAAVCCLMGSLRGIVAVEIVEDECCYWTVNETRMEVVERLQRTPYRRIMSSGAFGCSKGKQIIIKKRLVLSERLRR